MSSHPPTVDLQTDGFTTASTAGVMTRHTSRAPALYMLLAAASLLAAVLTGRAAMVSFAAPLATAVAVGLLRRSPAPPRAAVTVPTSTITEGETLAIEMALESPDRIERLEVAVDADGALGGPALARAVAMAPGGARTVTLEVPCPQWGVGRVRGILVRWSDPAGFTTWTSRWDVQAVVRVLPIAEAVRTLVRTRTPQLAAGSVVGRRLGEGLELGEVRQYRPGDRTRAINWRASARREGLWVTDRYIEHNVDVILAVDAVVAGALVRAVRGAQALADTYLAERDRVGIMGIGGTLQWLRPGGGAPQRHRITEQLIKAQSYAVASWGTGLAVPMSTLPPGALVIGLTSLLDDGSAGVLVDLRNRGFTVAVVEIGLEAPASRDPVTALGERLHDLQRAARRDLLRAQGVALARWREADPLEAVLAELSAVLRLRRGGSP